MGIRTPQEIWETALGELQLQVSRPNYRTWFAGTVGLRYDGNQFVVGVPNTFVAEYLDRNQRSLVERTVIDFTSRDVQVLFQVNGRHAHAPNPYHHEREPCSKRQTSSPALDPKYAFASFVECPCNRLAHAAALTVAREPGRTYNPLFICGETGTGKTHLLHAIGHIALANRIQVTCVTAERFTNDLVAAIRLGKTEEFRHRYRSAGMLLVDDVHFICGKRHTEESFVHTFDALHNANRQIVVTSTRLPASLPLSQERLRSRLEWGLVADLQQPDFESRMAILQAKAGQRSAGVNLEVVRFIAERVHGNIMELEGCLNRVVARATLLGAPVTVGVAAQAVADEARKKPGGNTVTAGLVTETVAACFGLATPQIKGHKRDKETSLARRVAMYLIRQETNCSLPEIGRELGGRDAAAVTTACKKIASDVDSSPYLRRKIRHIRQRLHVEE
jgi:chromosomal replication initiator protein